jgi:hypothetical protein
MIDINVLLQLSFRRVANMNTGTAELCATVRPFMSFKVFYASFFCFEPFMEEETKMAQAFVPFIPVVEL